MILITSNPNEVLTVDIWTSDVGMEYKTSGWGYNEDPYKISNVFGIHINGGNSIPK